MNRSLLALWTALCLLAGTLMVPAKAELVCRWTGQAMEPVPAGRARGSCCGVTLAAADGAWLRYALANPGCCDLRQSPQRPELPALRATAPAAPVVATLPAAPAFSTPPLVEAVVVPPSASESPPRAPPLRSASPRGPPVFS